MPTYKRNKHEDGYMNKKNQAPSYTDRIIFKNNTECEAEVNNYNSLESVYGSDHRPVIMDLTLQVKRP